MSTPAERRYSCADTSQGRAEPIWGTASTAPAWLLVEESGPWGPGSVPSSRLGEDFTAALRGIASARSARLLFIRRPLGRPPADASHRRLYWARSRRGSEHLLTRTTDVGDLQRSLADDDGWQEVTQPLFLVCTHGRKDWCCALRGRPVAAALAEAAGEDAWECSHLGGDRFAANLLTVPTGLTYGRVDADDVAELVAATRAGGTVPRLLRGRSTDALVVQAADAIARTSLARTDVDDLVPRSARRTAQDHEGGDWEVHLAGSGVGGPDVLVRLRHRVWGGPVRLTCGASGEQRARTFVPLGVELVGEQ